MDEKIILYKVHVDAELGHTLAMASMPVVAKNLDRSKNAANQQNRPWGQLGR